MRKVMIAALAALVLGSVPVPGRAEQGDYMVVGVEAGDMLKMRAGPGIGFRVIVGLPNGTIVRVQDCEQTGGTRWCRVVLKEARTLRGYVSWTYLREQ